MPHRHIIEKHLRAARREEMLLAGGGSFVVGVGVAALVVYLLGGLL